MSEPYLRAQADAQQDYFENAPFASVGGLARRADMVAPRWIEDGEHVEYLCGYRDACQRMFGADWLTVEFCWVPAVTLPGVLGEES